MQLLGVELRAVVAVLLHDSSNGSRLYRSASPVVHSQKRVDQSDSFANAIEGRLLAFLPALLDGGLTKSKLLGADLNGRHRSIYQNMS